MTLTAPAPLRSDHDTTAFDCGNPDLNAWLRRFALTNQSGGAARTYVTCQDTWVMGYYALAATGLYREDVTARVAHAMPQPIPAILLGRLAIDKTRQGSGLGGFLLLDAVRRVVNVAHEVGVRVLVTHAVDEGVAAFYARHDFIPSDADPLRMMLLLKDARALLGSP